MLCEFTYHETIYPENKLNNNKEKLSESVNFTSKYESVKVIKSPVWIEYLLIFWILSLILEETRQVSRHKINIHISICI